MTASDLAGRRIREARKRRDWTVKDLADHCAKTGAGHITATVITNLETRRRASREITADELLVLAHVLDVPPIQLISPLNAGEGLQVTPGVHMDALEASAWLGNDSPLNPPAMLRRARRTIKLIRADYRALQQQDSEQAREEMTRRGDHLMVVMNRLTELGYEPPGLDPEVTAALSECGLPASLAEWRAGQEDESDF